VGLKVIIPGKFPGLNDFIYQNRVRRGNWSAGNAMKQRDIRTICSHLPKVRFKKAIFLEYHFFEPNSRRDKDNISGYFHKVFQDALVKAGCIEDDGWKNIEGMSDRFDVDKGAPRIEIVIKEAKK